MKILKVKLKEMLIKRGYSQRQFVEMSGIRYETVSQLCTNKVKAPYLDHMAACCEILKCELADLLELVDVPGERQYNEVVLRKYDARGRRRQDDIEDKQIAAAKEKTAP